MFNMPIQFLLVKLLATNLFNVLYMQGQFCCFIQHFEKQAIDVVNLEAFKKLWYDHPTQDKAQAVGLVFGRDGYDGYIQLVITLLCFLWIHGRAAKVLCSCTL